MAQHHESTPSKSAQPTPEESLGTATQPRYNPNTFMWVALISLPLLMLFMLMIKANGM